MPLPLRRARRTLRRAGRVLRTALGQTAALVTPAAAPLLGPGHTSKGGRDLLELTTLTAGRGTRTSEGGEGERKGRGDDQQAGKERHFERPWVPSTREAGRWSEGDGHGQAVENKAGAQRPYIYWLIENVPLQTGEAWEKLNCSHTKRT